MPKHSTFATDILGLIFNATSIANLAVNATASIATSMVIALHTADPIAGTQSTSEISYTGYARVSVIRTTGGWTAPSGGVTGPVANIDFGAMTAGAGGTVTHMSIGHTPTTTANRLIYSGTVTPNIVVANGVTPRITTATTITET